MNPKPLVITMDTNPNENSYRFLKTMVDQEWSFRLIGTDKEWKTFLHRAMDYKDELINISKSNPKKICVISDCKDVLCVRISNKFIEVFETFKSPIVVSGELLCAGHTDPKYLDTEQFKKYNCNPITNFWLSKGYNLDNLPDRKYVNAGLVCGYVEDLINMYDWIITKGVEEKMGDDQILMGKFINENPNLVEVDINAILLHTSVFGPTAGYLNQNQLNDSPTFSEILGRGAFFIHLPNSSSEKGNGMIYKMISLIIDNGFNNKNFIKPYNMVEKNIPLNWYLEKNL